MKFRDFLMEEDTEKNTLVSVYDSIIEHIGSEAKQLDIFPLTDLYFEEYKTLEAELSGNKITGYFVYKKDFGNQDDFYYAKFVYDTSKNDLDLTVDNDENSKSYTSVVDIYNEFKKMGLVKLK